MHQDVVLSVLPPPSNRLHRTVDDCPKQWRSLQRIGRGSKTMTYVGGPCADHGTPGAPFSGRKWPLPLLLLALTFVCSSAEAGIGSNGKVVVDDKSFGC